MCPPKQTCQFSKLESENNTVTRHNQPANARALFYPPTEDNLILSPIAVIRTGHSL